MPLTSTQWLTSLSFAPWFIPKVWEELADEVEKWGNWVIENVRAEIGTHPPIKVGEVLQINLSK